MVRMPSSRVTVADGAHHGHGADGRGQVEMPAFLLDQMLAARPRRNPCGRSEPSSVASTTSSLTARISFSRMMRLAVRAPIIVVTWLPAWLQSLGDGVQRRDADAAAHAHAAAELFDVGGMAQRTGNVKHRFAHVLLAQGLGA